MHTNPDTTTYRRLRGLVDAVLSAPEGTRNGTLNWATYRAVTELAGAYPIHQLRDIFTDTGIHSGLPASESAKTVASALRSSGAAA